MRAEGWRASGAPPAAVAATPALATPPAEPPRATTVPPLAPHAVAAAAALDARPAAAAQGLAWPSFGGGSGTGSSLLDTLFGAEGAGAGFHYPLLDALGDAMRGSIAEPSPRHWPAARVDIALPELLRRVAAGVRVARSAA